jgi:general secretion pathway protein A
MMAAYALDEMPVTAAHVHNAVEELRWVEYAERSVRLPSINGINIDATGDRPLPLGRVLLAIGGQTVAEKQLSLGRFIIGRTPDNDLQVDSKFISRHHAQIITTLQGSTIEDLNSTNGIYVRTKRVRRRMLNDGDVIHIGQHEIMYVDERVSRGRMADVGEDDAVPMLHEGLNDESAHDATQVQRPPVPVDD